MSRLSIAPHGPLPSPFEVYNAAVDETNGVNRGGAVPQRRAAVRDIAAHTGVSTATVSRVLNDHASVAPRTWEHPHSAHGERPW
jgi:hypothetical protein